MDRPDFPCGRCGFPQRKCACEDPRVVGYQDHAGTLTDRVENHLRGQVGLPPTPPRATSEDAVVTLWRYEYRVEPNRRLCLDWDERAPAIGDHMATKWSAMRAAAYAALVAERDALKAKHGTAQVAAALHLARAEKAEAERDAAIAKVARLDKLLGEAAQYLPDEADHLLARIDAERSAAK